MIRSRGDDRRDARRALDAPRAHPGDRRRLRALAHGAVPLVRRPVARHREPRAARRLGRGPAVDLDGLRPRHPDGPRRRVPPRARHLLVARGARRGGVSPAPSRRAARGLPRRGAPRARLAATGAPRPPARRGGHRVALRAPPRARLLGRLGRRDQGRPVAAVPRPRPAHPRPQRARPPGARGGVHRPRVPLQGHERDRAGAARGERPAGPPSGRVARGRGERRGGARVAGRAALGGPRRAHDRRAPRRRVRAARRVDGAGGPALRAGRAAARAAVHRARGRAARGHRPPSRWRRSR